MVTWKALGCIALLLIGLGTVAYGSLMTFAAGMSDQPSSDATSGCGPIIVGIAICAAAIVGFVL